MNRRDNKAIIDENKKILRAANVVRVMSTQVSDHKSNLSLHIIDHPLTEFELKSMQFSGSYVLENSGSSWKLNRVLVDTTKTISLEIMPDTSKMTEKQKTLQERMNGDLQKINDILKNKTPSTLTLADQVTLRKALDSYQEHKKDFKINTSTYGNLFKTMGWSVLQNNKAPLDNKSGLTIDTKIIPPSNTSSTQVISETSISALRTSSESPIPESLTTRKP